MRDETRAALGVPSRAMRLSAPLALLFGLSAGCWNYRDQLERADVHYHAARYEAAVANLDDLEPALGQLEPSERARFAWLEGMSHLRLGHRALARHWLARAREMLEHGASLPEADRAQLLRTLAEVDWVAAPREGNGAREAAPSVPSGTEPQDSAARARKR